VDRRGLLLTHGIIGMFSLSQPTEQRIERFLASQCRRQLSYAEVGQSRTAHAPPGMFVNHGRVKLGRGEETFRSAREALANWRMFPAWIRLRPVGLPISEGNVVMTIARCFGLWTVNACRIVYVIEDATDVTRFGFGYGTLEDHAMIGEERFLVTWDHRDGAVWYDVWSFSKPRHWAARLAVRFIRGIQRRFARDSCAAMLDAVMNTAAKYQQEIKHEEVQTA
jgi:uncharacterized protein (UPF0548 family)